MQLLLLIPITGGFHLNFTRIHIENLWRIQKNHSQLLNRFFLQNNNRIEGLTIMLSLGALAHAVMQATICYKVDERPLRLPYAERKTYDPKPVIGRICRYFYRVNMSVSFKLTRNNKIKIETYHFDKFVCGALSALERARSFKYT